VKLLVTGACGFVGSVVLEHLRAATPDVTLIGLDNLSRAGSELNRARLRSLGVRILHGDIRIASDLETLGPVDWIIDAAANPSVLAGIVGATSSRQLIEHNLVGTINLLELCKRHHSGLIILSTSRVYSLERLSALGMTLEGSAFTPRFDETSEPGLSTRGVSEAFSTEPPLSLYGSSKLASELLAREYGAAFGFPVHINRCGVLGGAGQFGKPDQGIIAFWIHAYAARRPLKYIGFGGSGHQVRDCLHPRDLVPLLLRQMASSTTGRVLNVGGGAGSRWSLAQLTAWCRERFGAHEIGAEPNDRPLDVPWLVLDAAAAESHWTWRPSMAKEEIFEEVAQHAESNPDWLERSAE
jgi:CDP-paratose 2-epimerase